MLKIVPESETGPSNIVKKWLCQYGTYPYTEQRLTWMRDTRVPLRPLE
jgi:hypothetical protein